MNQVILDRLWRLNRIAIARGLLGVAGVFCIGDSFEETIDIRNRTWHRATGTRRWQRIKPLKDNLLT